MQNFKNQQFENSNNHKFKNLKLSSLRNSKRGIEKKIRNIKFYPNYFFSSFRSAISNFFILILHSKLAAQKSSVYRIYLNLIHILQFQSTILSFSKF